MMISRAHISVSAALLLAYGSAPTKSNAEASPKTPEVRFMTNPAGSIFFYDPGSATPAKDGKMARIKVRVVYSENLPRIFQRQPASSTVIWVFNCVQRTYEEQERKDYDAFGKQLLRQELSIELNLPAQPVIVDVEPLYRAACGKN